MSLELIWAAIARQSLQVTGIKGAYAISDDFTTGVRAWPDDITDGPIVRVEYAGTEMENAGSYERLAHEFSIDIWTPLGNANRAGAVALLAPMFERFVIAFRANNSLYGTAMQSEVGGSSGFDDISLNDKPFLVQSISIRAQEARNVSPGIGS